MGNYPLTFTEFKEALREGKLLGLRCRNCGLATTPPNRVCFSCGSPAVEKVELAPEATIRTFTVIRTAPEGFEPPYIVALAQLRDGPTVLGNVVDIDPHKADMSLIGRRVRVGGRFFPDPENRTSGEGIAFTFEPVE